MKSFDDLIYFVRVFVHVLESAVGHLICAEVPSVELRNGTGQVRNVVFNVLAIILSIRDRVGRVVDCFLAMASQDLDLRGLRIIVHSESVAELVLVHTLSFDVNKGVGQYEPLEVDVFVTSGVRL